MKRIKSIAAIMRLPNVVVIILTQFLLRYGLIRPFLFGNQKEMMSGWLEFSLLVLATVLVAVGGYIINDVFDAGIDEINRPGKNRVGRDITERSAVLMYRILNGIAIIISVYISFRIKSLTFFLIFPFVIYMLWLYSAHYKKMLAWGNIVVSFLSALVIFMVWYFEYLNMMIRPDIFATVLPNMKNLTIFFVFYMAFAFHVTLFREIIKDIEDRKGDEEFNCRTIVVVYGERIAKIVASAVIVMTIILLFWFQQIMLNRGWTTVIFYFAIVVQIPMLFVMFRLYSIKKQEDYHFLSSICKIIMFAGILSIQLIYTSL